METHAPKPKANPEYDMIVFCHLRWDFVYQRPQHIISRLAKDYRILVVEEPQPTRLNGNSPLEVREITPNIHVFRPPVQSIKSIGTFLKKHLKKQTFPVGWFYSPAFVPVLEYLDFETVVYDCMDELSLFKGASAELISQEKQLLAAADIVYTGGKSLYESKKQKHHNVFCFPSSVDIGHFASENNTEISLPDDLKDIPTPIVGYYGVIDERIDLDLLKETAAKCPDTSFVMIGPLCKIEDHDLPRAKNIHYLGMKSYEELPQYLHFFDVAMMPFALNDSTKYISPTKTLEYMSAYKPIISTKVRDVVRDYSNCIALIDDAENFAKAISEAPERDLSEYGQILEKTSWDATAEQMSSIIQKVTA